jgi:hypothetical protein
MIARIDKIEGLGMRSGGADNQVFGTYDVVLIEGWASVGEAHDVPESVTIAIDGVPLVAAISHIDRPM